MRCAPFAPPGRRFRAETTTAPHQAQAVCILRQALGHHMTCPRSPPGVPAPPQLAPPPAAIAPIRCPRSLPTTARRRAPDPPIGGPMTGCSATGAEQPRQPATNPPAHPDTSHQSPNNPPGGQQPGRTPRQRQPPNRRDHRPPRPETRPREPPAYRPTGSSRRTHHPGTPPTPGTSATRPVLPVARYTPPPKTPPRPEQAISCPPRSRLGVPTSDHHRGQAMVSCEKRFAQRIFRPPPRWPAPSREPGIPISTASGATRFRRASSTSGCSGSVGIPVWFFDGAQSSQIAAGLLGDGDVALVVSRSGAGRNRCLVSRTATTH